ncbi:TMEM175 family protein [Arthrobacter sp. 35W]|uniref:TMEM175 family protein n=1 Tax=Arthrobacter sp. 35W TaxID=1132441 RepID=UPI00040E627E|nr:TMEM175 family protein [Arthrobacter sp. 35W]
MGKKLRRSGAGPALSQALAARVAAKAGALHHGPSTERTVFFSDAVFAIAMTLLVLDLKPPELPDGAPAAAVQDALLEDVPALAAFMLSFALVGATWINHHRRFKAIAAYNGTLQSINLVVLFFVAFLPVPTALLFQTSSESPWPPALYALTVVGIFVSLNWLWRYARTASLMEPSVDEPLYRLVLWGNGPVWVVFLLSIPVAFINPTAATYCWILIWPLSQLHGRWACKRFAAAEAAALRAEETGPAPSA